MRGYLNLPPLPEPMDLSEFRKISKEEWKTLAAAQLKGIDPFEELSWENEELLLQPYYDRSDIGSIQYLPAFFNKIKPFRWKLYELIEVTNEKEANRCAIEALEGGCDGVIFRFSERPDLRPLLKGINTEICDTSFISTGATADKEAYPKIRSGFRARPGSSDVYVQKKTGLPPIEVMADCMSSASMPVDIIRYASGDFFLEIALLRAFRYLIHEAWKEDPFHFRIHTIVSTHENPEYQWFLNAVSGLAGVLGGATSICFTTAVGKRRISRNVGNLIREESKIKWYEDQCNGSYYIESLTHQIIQNCKTQMDDRK